METSEQQTQSPSAASPVVKAKKQLKMEKAISVEEPIHVEVTISDEEIMYVEEIKETLANEDLAAALDKINDYFQKQDRMELNIAVTGESGSGKSTFINAFRGMGDEEEGSAETGVVETTRVPTPYAYTKYPNVKLWDLPGIGTPNFKADQYLKDVEFQRYDFFIIIASDRFRECHASLAAEIVQMNKKFYFLRSKIDHSISDEKRKKTFDEQKTLDLIRENCNQGLKEAGVDSPVVFLISSFDLALYDFNQLEKTIEVELPQHKRHVLMLAIPNITLEINERKRKVLLGEIWKFALLSAGVTAVPIPVVNAAVSVNVDVAIVTKAVTKFYKAFSVDPASLQRLSDRTGKSVDELKSVIESPLNKDLINEGINYKLILKLLACTSLFALNKIAETWLGCVPILACLAAGPLSFATVYVTLKRCLDELAEDARKVLMAALQSDNEK